MMLLEEKLCFCHKSRTIAFETRKEPWRKAKRVPDQEKAETKKDEDRFSEKQQFNYLRKDGR